MSEWVEGDNIPYETPVIVDLGAGWRQFQVAYKSEKITVVGNHFDFDMPKILRWKTFLNEEELEEYERRLENTN